MSHHPNTAKSIFLNALEIPSTEARQAYVVAQCDGNEALGGEVEALLRQHGELGSFLESPVVGQTLAMGSSSLSEGAGTVVGPYKLLQQIGEGGMGVVYMAEQQKPVRRRVALKIIKPGMDSKQVIARFEAERQALAMMEHPNIARVLDAGCTESGRPYFAMELVQGIPITQYCDDKQLSPQERLGLFVEICHAVQHAHQKGIIHRDLKPSNVLIAIYDGKPIPKIIDFGVAKALHQQLTEKTMFTQFGAVVGTLEYMSPEQADMDLMGTDTRSDIYSLGVLLYELLTGTTPMDGTKLRSLGYAEMLKTIREVDPPKPSTRLSQSAHNLTSISAKRHTEPRKLQKLVAGDLDWIVMKCLEKDRTRRYETANGLAMDIQRHLHDEAVTACPPGQLYKLQKLVRRNKLACAAAACVMLALVLGLAASLWQAGRANHEATRAQTEAERAAREADRARSAEHQALATLDELRATAPTFIEDAKTLAAKGQFDLAIEKINYAVKLQPNAPELLVIKGDLYLCQLKFPAATAGYHDALRLKPGLAPAEMKANLCDQLLVGRNSAQGKLSLESLVKIYSALEPEKRSEAELKAVAQSYAYEKERLRKHWLPRLQSLPMCAKISPGQNVWEGRFDIRNDGQLSLDLGGLDFSDLSQLKDLPVADLYLDHCNNITDVQPLADMPSLENITVPVLARNIEALHKLPRLMRLSFSAKQAVLPFAQTALLRGMSVFGINWRWNSRTPDTTADEFWKEYSNLSWLSRLRDSAIKPNEIRRKVDGTWFLNFEYKKEFTDLNLLHGMPVSELLIGETSVTDLTPLRGMPLKHLRLWSTRVGDLTPLMGMPIASLDICRTKIHDLSPLKGMPLDYLALDATEVTDLSPLRGMPLTFLRLKDCRSLTDLSPLTDVKKLAQLVLPPHFIEFDLLHKMPKLKRVSFDEAQGGLYPPDKTTDEFWKEYDPHDWRFALRKSGLKAEWMREAADGTWDVGLDRKGIKDLAFLHGAPISVLSLGGNDITDLTPLKGMPLKQLILWDTRVTDMSPLKGMQLELLWLDGTEVKDLSPLCGMPLTKLKLHGCANVTDLSPIAGAKELIHLILPPNAKDIEFLRSFPKLQRLSFDEDQNNYSPDKTAAEFWKEYDRAKGAGAP
jgi:serine/threonine protein kinase/tetratricopeptide (TPR) repeat protein